MVVFVLGRGEGFGETGARLRVGLLVDRAQVALYHAHRDAELLGDALRVYLGAGLILHADDRVGNVAVSQLTQYGKRLVAALAEKFLLVQGLRPLSDELTFSV